jgi:hypothetical protein
MVWFRLSWRRCVQWLMSDIIIVNNNMWILLIDLSDSDNGLRHNFKKKTNCEKIIFRRFKY